MQEEEGVARLKKRDWRQNPHQSRIFLLLSRDKVLSIWERPENRKISLVFFFSGAKLFRGQKEEEEEEEEALEG